VKITKYRSNSNQIIKGRGRTVHSEIHNFNSIWNKVELPAQWRESIIVPICKKGDKTDCTTYRDISLLSTTYKILSKFLLSRLTAYTEEPTGDHQCGF
jgi:hypothetical protein